MSSLQKQHRCVTWWERIWSWTARSNRGDLPHPTKGLPLSYPFTSPSLLSLQKKACWVLLTQQGHDTEQIKQFSNSLMQIIPSAHYSSQMYQVLKNRWPLLKLLEKVYLISQATEWFYAIFWIILNVFKMLRAMSICIFFTVTFKIAFVTKEWARVNRDFINISPFDTR